MSSRPLHVNPFALMKIFNTLEVDGNTILGTNDQAGIRVLNRRRRASHTAHDIDLETQRDQQWRWCEFQDPHLAAVARWQKDTTKVLLRLFFALRFSMSRSHSRSASASQASLI
jgi:hypothetical protein